MSGTIGLGNIAGVAVISIGGPGAMLDDYYSFFE